MTGIDRATEGLSESEREALWSAHTRPGPHFNMIIAAVERILAARAETVAAERDAALTKWHEAQEHIAYHLRDFRPTADMAATGDLAVDMAAYADRCKARAESAEAALAARAAQPDPLREKVAALADEWETSPNAGAWHAYRLRELLLARDETPEG